MRRLLVILIFVVGCKTVEPPIPSETDHNSNFSYSNQPDWVRVKPQLTDYYVGIGNASLKDPDYLSNAKLEALDDLASEIQVKIESNSLLSQVENQTDFRERFQSSITSSSSQSFQGHEQVANWAGDRFYWVQYRLHKTDFIRHRHKKKNQALDLATVFYSQALKAEQDDEIVSALHLYARCIEALGDYLNERNDAVVNNYSVDLSQEAYSKLITYITGIHLTKGSSIDLPGTNHSKKEIVIVAVANQSTPVSNLKIELSTGRNFTTNRSGAFDFQISSKSATTVIELAPSFDFLGAYPFTWGLVKNIHPTSLTLRLDLPVSTFRIDSKEMNLGKSTDQSILKALLTKILTDSGYQVAESDGDYSIEITADTRKGSSLSGLHTAYLDVKLAIKSQADITLYSNQFSNIKGIHNSYEAAGQKAYHNVEEDLADEIKQSIWKYFNQD